MQLFSRSPRTDPDRAAQLLAAREAVVLDVRQVAEWNAGRIKGAINIPLPRLHAELGRLPRDTTIITVCRSGHRSAVAARMLRGAGYQVENLHGGMSSWARAGMALEPGGGRVL
jgi:rhodanese-related sulfurtransferase